MKERSPQLHTASLSYSPTTKAWGPRYPLPCQDEDMDSSMQNYPRKKEDTQSPPMAKTLPKIPGVKPLVYKGSLPTYCFAHIFKIYPKTLKGLQSSLL